MEQVTVTSVEELRSYFEGLGEGFLFRGQVAHFGSDDHPNVVTSFDRKGCIPSEMMKWIRYSDNVLQVWLGPNANSLEFEQALLQHYGWRSFYVDCSLNPAIAAWFASHVYRERPSGELCEDYEERPVLLRKRMADYEFEDGQGHLYVFSRALAEKTVGVADLSALKVDGSRLRPQAQDACLIGSFRNQSVPKECFVAHIKADRSILRAFAAEAGLNETHHLFPSSKEDPILGALLGLPWKEFSRVPDKPDGIPIFRRTLDLPEYEDSFVKIASPRTAFYRGARVADGIDLAGAKDGGIVVQVPDIAIFGTADAWMPLHFPKVRELLAQHRCVAFEVDQLIQHANLGNNAYYQKGVVAWEHEPGLVELCEMMVEHPGLDLTRATLVPGWYYRVDAEGVWKRELNAADCDCGRASIHQRHISALQITERFLQAPEEFEGL